MIHASFPTPQHPIIGKWKLVATAKGYGQYVIIPDSSWVSIENEMFQEFRADSTFENWMMYFENVPEFLPKNKDSMFYYISDDSIIYRNYDGIHKDWLMYAFIQLYELSENKNELTLYLCGMPPMDGNAAKNVQYKNFKLIRVEE